jgi:hypothetical protein
VEVLVVIVHVQLSFLQKGAHVAAVGNRSELQRLPQVVTYLLPPFRLRV